LSQVTPVLINDSADRRSLLAARLRPRELVERAPARGAR
jgi:hypothetical protein